LWLYETIVVVGGLLGLEQQRAAAIHHGQDKKVKLLLKRRKDLQAELAKLIPTLTNDETGEILERYPWVARC
jgi:phage host-nuclease inhibitor protein Gam